MAMANVDKGELMDQVKQQIAVANAQELLQQMTQKCFKKCINKPGTSLDSSEQVYGLVEPHLADVRPEITARTIKVLGDNVKGSAFMQRIKGQNSASY